MIERLRGSRITVAGASGFIGQHLVDYLARSGARVRAVVHDRNPAKTLEQVEYVSADLRDRHDAAAVVADTEIFVMAAAQSSGAGVMARSPLAHLVPNIVMNANTLEASLAAGVQKYVFISSSTVYPPGDYSMTEEEAIGNFFPAYEVVARMKHYSETMAKQYEEHSSGTFQVLTVRPSNLYGPGDKFSERESKVIPALIRRAVQRQNPFVVWGDGKDLKDFLYIDDFVEGLCSLLGYEGEPGVVNIASGESVELLEVVPEILRTAGHTEATVNYDESKPSMIPVRRINRSKIHDLIGWTPTTGLPEGLRKTINWYVNS